MSPMTKSILCAVSIVAVIGATPALAGQGGPCAEDAKKLCPDQKGKALRDCMQKNADKLSDGCKAKKEQAMKMKEACKGDAEKFCKDVKPGKGRIHECLKKHEGELSGGCKDAMKSMPARGGGKGPQN